MTLLFHPESLKKIAEISILKKTGARGLRRILENLLNEALYEFPGSEIKFVVIDADLKVHGFLPTEMSEAIRLADKSFF